MTRNFREILRLKSLGLNITGIAGSAQCVRNTMPTTLERAEAFSRKWPLPEGISDKELVDKLFPSAPWKATFKMPDYAYVHRDVQRNGVTPTLLWMEHFNRCRAEGTIPYWST